MKSEKTITVIDSFSGFGHHEQFNACLALMLVHEFSNVRYKLGNDQYDCIKRVLADFPESKDIRWTIIPVKKNSYGKINLLLKYLQSAITNIWSIITCKSDMLIYASNNPFSAHAIKLINKLRKKNIFIINHGELEYITSDSNIPYSKLTRLAGRLMRNSIKLCPSTNIKYIVLGKNIVTNLQDLLGPYSAQFVHIDHPYLFKASAGNATRKKVAIKNANDKGDNEIFIRDLANRCPHVDFEIIASHVDGPFPANVTNRTKIRQLSREEYEEMLSTYSLIIYTYSTNEYKLKVSGAIFDNIDHGIPLLSLRNDYFNYIFGMTGSLGILYEDNASLLKGAIDYLGKSEHRDPDYSEAFSKAKQIFSLGRIEKQLSDILLKE